MTTKNNSILDSIRGIMKISYMLIILGFIIFLFVLKLMFAIGWIMGSVFCLLYLLILAFMIKKIFANGTDGAMLRFGLMFIAKTGVLLLLLGVIIYFLNKISSNILYGFIAGLFLLPFAIFIFAVCNGLKRR